MLRRPLAVWLILVAVACGGADKAPDAARASTFEVDSTPVAVSGLWPAELGDALVIPSDTENVAVVLYPASLTASLDPKSQLTLLAPGGDTVRVRVGVSSMDTVHCGDAPMVRLGRATPEVWSLGVGGLTARTIHADSIEGLSPADSLAYSVEAARMASAVTTGNGSRLRGLPFSLVSVRRLRLGDTTILAAQLVRRVNLEANPAEERTFVIGERTSSSPFTTVHSDRSEGTEETAAHYDLIGAFRAGAATYWVISTDAPNGSTVQMLERVGGKWSLRWARSISC